MLSLRTSRRRLPIVLGAVLVAASIPAAASAATQRYASPTGSGTECSSFFPCEITQAVNGAAAGDEVIVNAGDYALTDLTVSGGITVHGVPGGPRPRLLFNNAPTVSMGVYDSTLRYVEVVRDPGEAGVALGADDASLDQVIIRGTALPNWPTVFTKSSIIRDSIVVAPGSGGTAIRVEANGASEAGTFRNVTAIATESGGVAIRARATGHAGYASVLARNVIARGGSGPTSFRAETDSTGATAKITFDHSNWQGSSTTGTNASIVQGGGSQSDAPGFVSPAAGDYRQATWSPTIDAGLDEFLNSAFDIDGDPRPIGSNIDIGADEFVVAPAVITGPAGAVTDHSATVSGSVEANAVPTSYHFEYGPTTAYGSATPAADAGSGGAVTAAATLDGLTPATTFHYRLVATNAGGVTKGADRTFATASPPSPTPISAPPSPTPTSMTQPSTTQTPATMPAFAGVKPVSTRLAFRGTFITLRLSCPAATVGRCSGRAKLTARRRASAGTERSVTLGRAPFSIAAGTRARVRIRVSRAGRRLLGRARRLTAKDINAARDSTGRSRTTRTAVTIRRHHR